METASVSHDEEHQHAVISFADGAKVQQNSETTKDLAKKSCHPIQDDSTTSPNHTFQAHSISFLLEYPIQQPTNNQPKEVRSQRHRKEVYE